METFELPVEVAEEPVKPKELQATLAGMIEQAVQHYEENLEPLQTEATDFYMGRPFGNEEEGRSQVVSTDLRDTVQAVMPSLMRIYCGPERVVEFRPRTKDKVEIAAQQTDAVNYVVMEDNDGYMVRYAAFKDALVRKLGIVKWWNDESTRVESDEYSGLTEMQVALLSQEPGVELEVLEAMPGITPEGPQTLMRVRVTRTTTESIPRIAAVPPNEFVFTPDARDLDSAPLVAHKRETTVGELVAMGIDRELAEKHKGKERGLSSEDLAQARQFHDGAATDFGEGAEGDESVQPVLFTEAYALVDLDDDGIPERRKFWCVGPDYEIANGEGEIVDEVPFTVYVMDPEPHTIVGLCQYDLTKDIQRIKSEVLRATMNSLALSVEQATEVVTGEVNMQDVLSREVHKVIRVRRPGMIRELKHSFVGGDTLPVLEYMDDVKENRTGQTEAAAGLDADSLQSSTKAAVAATLSAAQQRTEMIARNFAEGERRLFKGLLKLMVKHQNRPRMMRLRGEYVEVDPRSWDASMDVVVNVALGAGTAEEKLQLLGMIAEKQEQHILQGSPLVGYGELRNTYARIIELAGLKNVDSFFKPFGPQEEQALQQQAQQGGQSDPAQQLVQIEQQKMQVQAQIDAGKLMLEREKIVLEDDRERDKIARECALKEAELELKYGVQLQTEQIYAQVEADRVRMDADVKQKQAEQKAELQREQMQQQAQAQGGSA